MKYLPVIACGIAALFLIIIISLMLRACHQAPANEEEQIPVPVPSIWHRLHMPTDSEGILDEPNSDVFQPTASGRLESALYGTTRTDSRGRPRFHEGIDIAPLQRDRRGHPLDKVYAIADGRVAYANRSAGGSNYGRYIVLLHEDPLGEMYSLYAHLATLDPEHKPGYPVRAGQVLGTMGNTPERIIPMSRAHLHFEVGMVLNSRFQEWMQRQHGSSAHGLYHGWNLLSFDPLAFLQQAQHGDFRLATFVAEIPIALEVVIISSREMDYFLRYPQLWQGSGTPAGAMVIAACQNGIPLFARQATADESAVLSKTRRAAVLQVYPEALGRNGRALVTRRSDGTWSLTSSGRSWLSMLVYPDSGF